MVAIAIVAAYSFRQSVVDHLARNGTAFGNGNSYTDLPSRNAIVHAHQSAETAYNFGRVVAEQLGDFKERFQPGDYRDTWKDQWNNEVGRRMAEWAKANGYTSDVIDRLMLDALQKDSSGRSELIIDELTDPRVTVFDYDNNGTLDHYEPPNPTWREPKEWDPSTWGGPNDPLRPRDYTGVDDPLGDLGDWAEGKLDEFVNWADRLFDRTLEELSEATEWISDLWDWVSKILSDPLVLDLDGDGVELISLETSQTMFDLDDDGVAERTGWASPHDGFLVHDANGNGVVDSVAELFGSANVDGFDELKTIDANSDGRIDALDPAFAQLHVWRDLNSDGVSTSDEMLSLAAAGINRFNLSHAQSNTEVGDNVIARTGSYVRTDGTTRNMASVEFALDQVGHRPGIPAGADLESIPLLPNLPASAIADLRTSMFHDPALRTMVEALVFGNQNFETFQDFADGGFIDVLYRWTGVDTSIPEYPDSPYYIQVFEAVTGASIEISNDHQREQFAQLWPEFVKQLGTQFLFQAAQNPTLDVFYGVAQSFAALDPNSPTYQQDLSALAAAAESQTAPLEPAYAYLKHFTTLTFNPPNGALTGDFDALVAEFLKDQPSFATSVTGFAGSSSSGAGQPSMIAEAATGSEDYRHPWTAWYEDQGSLLFTIADGMGISSDYVLNATGWRWLSGFATTHKGTSSNDLIDQTVTYHPITSWHLGRAGWEVRTEYIPTHDQRLFGYGGDDELRGNDGVDRLIGGLGNDLLKGGWGSDMYVYAFGDGLDRIIEENGAEDVIYFSSEFNAADLRVSRITGTNDLKLHFGNAAEGIVLANQWGSSAAAVEQFHFVAENGLNAGDIASLYLATLATAGNDTITGSWAGERLLGLDGNDTLTGGDGNDVLDGGAGIDTLSGDMGHDRLIGGAGDDRLWAHDGDDTLIGGPGNDRIDGGWNQDTYVYNAGDGNDLLFDNSYDTDPADTLIFGPGIEPGNVVFSRVPGDFWDMKISFFGQAGSIIVDGQNGNLGIETIRFADGTIWNSATISAKYVADQRTEGADTIWGTEFADVIQAGAGNDVVVANNGDDTLIGGAGDDRLDGGWNQDTYVYNAGDGHDLIFDNSHDSPAGDTLIFGQGINPADVVFSRVAEDFWDMKISFAGQTGSIIIDGQSGNQGIETILFADGTMWNLAMISAKYVADQRTEGADVIWGTEAGDSINGGAGNDDIASNNGNDTLIGGPGNDRLDGNWGQDTYVYNPGDGDDTIIDSSGDGDPPETLISGQGINPADIVFSRVATNFWTMKISFANQAGSILIEGQNGDQGIEIIRFADGTVWNLATISGKYVADQRSDGADTIWGTEAADVIDGGAGDDLIVANNGHDVLSGGQGVDRLDGGWGNDVFRFSSGDTGTGTGADRIVDFATGADKIDLTGFDADAMSSGDQAFVFIGTSTFSNQPGQLRFAQSGGDTRISADIDGDGIADLEIVLSGTKNLTASDFIL